MSSSSYHLPPPGQLILDNLTILCGSPTAFSSRYGHCITDKTFVKPGNSAIANACLHFLLCVIDGDLAIAQFRPCWPVLDRQQERDFRRVVDIRLAALEKQKLIPVGVARKSVVGMAGGDRFVDLLWSLSVLALQRACLTDASVGALSFGGSASDLGGRLVGAGRADSGLSHQSSARSSRSLLRGTSVAGNSSSEKKQVEPRRFLGAGMLRAKETDEVRSRILAERVRLSRTSQMGVRGKETWALEADSLREKIGEFEAKVRRLKGQLADMGFDENGNDIRSGGEDDNPGPISQSCSGDDLRGQLKTSPIESMESGSSVDELLEPGEACDDLLETAQPCDHIAADLTRILAFANTTAEGRAELDSRFSAAESPVSTTSRLGGGKDAKPKDIVKLVRSAADELEQATRRMDEIQEARRKAEEAEVLLNTTDSYWPSDTYVSRGPIKPRASGDEQPAPGKLLESALRRHAELVESSNNLVNVVGQLTENSRQDIKKLPMSGSDDSLQTIDPVSAIPTPSWLTEHTVDASLSSTSLTHDPATTTQITSSITTQQAAISEAFKSSSNQVDTAKDVHLVSHALLPLSARSQTPRASTFSGTRRVKEPNKSSDRRHNRHVRSSSVTMAPRSRLDSLHGTPPSYLSVKTPRSVRFAALPPSYSANRTVGYQRQEPHPRASRPISEMYAVANVSPVMDDHDEAEDSDVSGASSVRDGRMEESRRVEGSRRTEKREAYVRRDLMGGGKQGIHRRVDVVDERFDCAGARASRLPRTQTPRRVVRRKEAIQRSVLEPAKAASKRPVKTGLISGKSEDVIDSKVTESIDDSMSSMSSFAEGLKGFDEDLKKQDNYDKKAGNDMRMRSNEICKDVDQIEDMTKVCEKTVPSGEDCVVEAVPQATVEQVETVQKLKQEAEHSGMEDIDTKDGNSAIEMDVEVQGVDEDTGNVTDEQKETEEPAVQTAARSLEFQCGGICTDGELGGLSQRGRQDTDIIVNEKVADLLQKNGNEDANMVVEERAADESEMTVNEGADLIVEEKATDVFEKKGDKGAGVVVEETATDVSEMKDNEGVDFAVEEKTTDVSEEKGNEDSGIAAEEKATDVSGKKDNEDSCVVVEEKATDVSEKKGNEESSVFGGDQATGVWEKKVCEGTGIAVEEKADDVIEKKNHEGAGVAVEGKKGSERGGIAVEEKATDVLQKKTNEGAGIVVEEQTLDAVQKKLFMSPEARVASPAKESSGGLWPDRGGERRKGIVRRAGSLLGNRNPRKAATSSSRKESSSAADLSTHPKEPSVILSGDEEEIVVSANQQRGRMSGRCAHSGRLIKGEGFFAGQTAQWQQNVQSKGKSDGRQMAVGSGRRSSVTDTGVANSAKGSGRDKKTASPRKSRVKSLRARLAAVLK